MEKSYHPDYHKNYREKYIQKNYHQTKHLILYQSALSEMYKPKIIQELKKHNIISFD